MRLAICMIVKNESAHLDRCLQSVQGLGDIYIVDTGSIDNTCEIARKYTDKVFENEYKWNDSFAEARNYVLDKCDADWVLSIDADEFLVDQGAVLKALDNVGNYNTVNVTLKAERHNSTHKFPRLFKRAACRWQGAIHNYLNVSEENNSDIVIVFGYSEAHKKDPDRAFRILSKEVEKPGKVRELYYLAREYVYRGKYTEAIDWYKKYLQVSKWVPEMADAYLMIAKSYIKLGKYMLARQHLVLAINLNNDFKEALELMGWLTGPKNSAKWYKWAHEANNDNVLFINDTRTPRDMQLITCIPDVFKYKSVLYIGAHEGRMEMLKDFRNFGYIIDIVEPFDKNVEYCKLIPGVDNVYLSTIQDFKPNKKYDIIFWWHGPEHISEGEINSTFKHIENMGMKFVILGCPWGKYEQTAIKGNDYEIHQKHWYPEELNRLGYKTNTIGTVDVKGSNLLAWKQLQGE